MESSNVELRRIRHLLTAILVCLVLILLHIQPALITIALLIVLVAGALLLALNASQAFRLRLSQKWLEFTSLWRR